MFASERPRRAAALIPPREDIVRALEETEEDAAILRGLLRLAHRSETTPEQRARLREALARMFHGCPAKGQPTAGGTSPRSNSHS